MSTPYPSDYNDPEASYRRGYHQGAKAAMDAVGRFTSDKLKDWVEVRLFKWRYHEDRSDRRVQAPPP
jgi:hypothetical protein